MKKYLFGVVALVVLVGCTTEKEVGTAPISPHVKAPIVDEKDIVPVTDRVEEPIVSAGDSLTHEGKGFSFEYPKDFVITKISDTQVNVTEKTNNIGKNNSVGVAIYTRKNFGEPDFKQRSEKSLIGQNEVWQKDDFHEMSSEHYAKNANILFPDEKQYLEISMGGQGYVVTPAGVDFFDSLISSIVFH